VLVASLGAAVLGSAVFATIEVPSLRSEVARLLSLSPVADEEAAAAPVASRHTRTVLGLARLMPEGDLIRVSPPYGAGDARISAILVSEGDSVAEGDLLATLDNTAALTSARLAAEATVAQRAAALAQARETVRIGILEARASVAEARAAADAARTRLARGRSLAERGVATVATLDDLEAASAQALQALARAEATLARWDTGSVDTQPDVVVAQAALDAARIDLDRAIRDLAKSEVRAPVAGVVLDIAGRPGERPGSDGLTTLGQTDRMMALVEVFQTEIGRLRVGQAVELSAVPLAAPLTGRVERVGLLVGRQNLVSDDTAANTDARVVEVLVRLDAQSSTRAADLSNLEAVARIAVGAPE
jgi:HlyD family secretion protein